MHWGNKLLLVFAVFGTMISYMVYRCTQMPVDLVTAAYYQDELAYQDIIDGTGKANALSSKPALLQEGRTIFLQLPGEMKDHPVTGTILFYCPADGSKDRRLQLIMGSGARQQIGPGSLTPGHYTVKISWKCGGVHYYAETPFHFL
jgi:hypothetical protein